MKIKGVELDINFEEELNEFHFERARIRDNKIQCCSPFRNELRPSFAINLTNGLWVDSGAEKDHLRKGNIISLLAYLKGVTFEEIEDYLLEKYSIDYKNTKDLKLVINLKGVDVVEKNVFNATYNHSNYLAGRGISDATQKRYKTFSTIKNNTNVIGIPWANKNGDIINIKYRAISQKMFFYEEKGEPIKHHLFGYDIVVEDKPKEVFIVESEIDVMTLYDRGLYGVALGRASVNDKQLKLLKKLDVDAFIIATDNDRVGKLIHDVLVTELLGHTKVKSLVFPSGVKDINDLSKDAAFWQKLPLTTNKIKVII